MKANEVKSRFIVLAKSGVRIVCWTTITASIGAAAGLVFGLMFGGIALVLNAESSSFINMAGYFAACGAAAGALVGACGNLGEKDTSIEPAVVPQMIAESVTGPVTIVHRLEPRRTPSRNRLAATVGTTRASREARASRDPSLN